MILYAVGLFSHNHSPSYGWANWNHLLW